MQRKCWVARNGKALWIENSFAAYEGGFVYILIFKFYRMDQTIKGRHQAHGQADIKSVKKAVGLNSVKRVLDV